MLKSLKLNGHHVFGFEVSEELNQEDYMYVLDPLLEKYGEEKVSLLLYFGPHFKKITFGAALEDLQLGIKHFNHFKKIAMVSDISWIKHSINIFAPLIPADVKTFSNDCLEDAKNWILEN